MGWLFPYGATRASLIKDLTEPRRDASSGWSNETLRHCTVGNVLWAVHELTRSDGSKVRYIGCYLLRRSRHGWGYKDLEESAHPVYVSCPLAYLDMVPVACPEWREKVRAYWARRHKRRLAREQAKRAGLSYAV